MFQAPIPPSARALLKAEVVRWGVEDLHLARCGRLSLARALAAPNLRLHLNDSSLYTAALAAYYSGAPFPARFRLELEDLGWMEPYVQDREGVIASVMLWADYAGAWARRDHPFYGRIAHGFRGQYPRLFDVVRKKLEGSPLKVAAFDPGPPADFIRSAPAGAGVILAPREEGLVNPALVEGLFEWPAPPPVEFDDEKLGAALEVLRQREHWAFLSEESIPSLQLHRRAFVDQNPALHLYASGESQVVRKPRPLEPLLIPHLGPDEELAPPLTLLPLSVAQFNALRGKYLNPNIQPGMAHAMVAVLGDGKVVGAIGVKPSDSAVLWPGVEAPILYLQTDFAVAPTRCRRLAKLVVMVALSRDFQLLVERQFSQRFRSIGTTVYTKKPVAQKYRGVLELVKRMEGSDADKLRGFDFKLNYAAPLGQWALEEVLTLWRDRFEKGEP